MFYGNLLAALLVIQFYVCSHSYKNTIDIEDIVNFVNNNPQSTWKADTYGMKTTRVRDFVRQKLGINRNNMKNHLYQKKELTERQFSQNDESIPSNFSWLRTNRTICKMDRIGDQSNCASQTMFAIVGSFSDRLCLETNGSMATPLSVEYVLSCNTISEGCKGMWEGYIYKFLKTNGTVTGGYYDSDEGCQPYSIFPCGGFWDRIPCPSNYSYTPKCKERSCTNDWYDYRTENSTYKIKDWYYIYPYYNDYKGQKEIYNEGPVITNFQLFEDFLFYKSGIYERSYPSKFLGYHDVKVVGYGIENGIKYWQAANSWGTSWGENGFFKIKRNECGFDNSFVAVTPTAT